MKTQKIAVMAILATILLMPTVNQVFADVRRDLPLVKEWELPKNGTLAMDSSNNVGIRVAFHFPAGEEVVDSFKAFTTKGTGVNRDLGVLPFQLQGIVSDDKPLLYESIDRSFYLGSGKTVFTDYKIFDVDVIFSRGDQNYRIFAYENCQVKDYNVDTLFDKEETYMGKTKFAYVENIDFQCEGLQLFNPTYDQLKEDQKNQATAEALAKMKPKS